MVATSAGLFGNLGANQGKLNTRKGKSFLWGGATRRMHGNDLKVNYKNPSKATLKKFRKQLKAESALVRQKQLLILTNSVLLAALVVMILI